MLRLLSIELQKLRYNRSVKVISIVYFSLILFISAIASIEFNFANVNFRIADQGIFNFPYIWHFNTYIAAILKIFLAIVIVSMMSNEYSYRTLKQNLIDGLSKKEFVISKFLTVVLFAVASTVFVFLVTMVLGLIFSDYKELGIIFSDLEYLFAYFIKLIGFFSFCMFLGIWVKRSAFAIGFLVIWQIFEGLVAIAFQYIRVKTDVNLFESVYNFFPLDAMADLISEPFSRLGAVQSAANQLGEAFTKTYEVSYLSLLIVCVWTFLFVYWSYALLKRRDL